MNSRHRKTLEAIFGKPTPANLHWPDVEALLLGIGCEKIEGAGSRVRFSLQGVVTVLHRPHPGNECTRPQVRSVRDFLERAEQYPLNFEVES
jgi:HicA toxin of bacterial toxin-antitoxin,